MKVVIYHKKDTHFCEAEGPVNLADYEPVYTFENLEGTREHVLEDAYCRSQNADGPWNPERRCRSTSVGDLMYLDDDAYYEVAGFGFEAVTIA